MSKSIRYSLALFLSFVLGLSPILTFASNTDRSKLIHPSTSERFTASTKRPKTTAARRPQNPAPATGQTSTLLPDGRLLLLGGEAVPQTTAAIKDPRTGVLNALPVKLNQARTGHSATMLPDGQVLILGGVGAGGQVLDSAELYDPESQTFKLISNAQLTPRAFHTATLLTEGQVLIVGGVSRGSEIHTRAELWDSKTQTATPLQGRLTTSRQRQRATLLPDGSVLIEGGVDEAGQQVGPAEAFEPQSKNFNGSSITSEQFESGAPYLAASLPAGGGTDVPVDARVALRFSKPVRVETLNPSTLKLIGPAGALAAKVVPAENGRLVFITPGHALEAGETYTVTLAGASDETDAPVSATVNFTTLADKNDADQSAQANLLNPLADWMPDASNLRGNWKSNQPKSSWEDQRPLQAAEGVTALAGQTLTLRGQPLANVTLQVEGQSTRTDGTGRFLLTSLAAGHHVMLIDGRTANGSGKEYGIFKVGVEVVDKQTSVLPYTIWMPKLDMGHAKTIASPTTSEVVITHPLIPGLELHLPPGTVIRDIDGQTVTKVSITPIPTDRPAFPLPPGYNIPVFFTIQLGGSRIIPPRARLIYPNYTNERPGTRISFWNYDPEGKGWYIYGQGTVSADGKQVIPDAGVVLYEFNGIMISSGGNPPGDGPNEGDDDNDGDPVDLSTGLFVLEKTDLMMPDTLPLAINRTYRQKDTAARAFGIGTSHTYEMFLWSVNNYQETDLILPHGGRIHYTRISPGTGYTDAVYEHTATPSAFYKSQIAWNGNGWDLKLKDGTVFVFPDFAPLKSIRDKFGNQITITRSSGNTGNITQVTSPNGRWIQFTYDTSSRVTQAKDNIGRTVNYTYDATGRLWKVMDANGGVTEYTYDTSDRMVNIKDAKGIIYLTNSYDANGRVLTQTQADNSTYQFAYTLDVNGKVTQTNVTDPLGHVRRVTFNADGYSLTDTFGLGTPQQQAFIHERQPGTNLVLSETDALGRKNAFAYDSLGHVTDVNRLADTASAVNTHFTYSTACSCSAVSSVTDPLNHTTTFDYDAKGSLSTITDPNNNHTTFTYNSSGQLTSITDPLLNTTQLGYDGADVVSVTNPKGYTTSRFLDAAGRMISRKGPLGETTRYEYDALNQLVKATDPQGRVTSYAYDNNGNLLSVTDANLKTTSYTYDNMDRLATRTDPLLHVETFQYDAAGNLTKSTDRRGKVTTYSYDPLERNNFVGFGTVTVGGNNTYESTVSYSYDAANRLTQAIDSQAGTITLGYDDLDHLTSETKPQGTISYTYDAGGRRTGMTVAGQAAVSYTYDNLDRLTGITKGASSVTLGYDAASRRTSLTLPNGVTVQYGYDAASQLTGTTYQLGTSVLGDLTYDYDAAGRRIKMGGSYARTGLPQPVGSATYNNANQLTQWGAGNLTYDANGNLTGDGVNTYTWDARNRLVSMSGGTTASFQYDAFGNRVRKTVGGTTTDYLFDGDNAVQELSGGTPTANVLTGLWSDEVFTRNETSGTQTFLADALGSTLALTDAAGAVQTQYTYEPFGKSAATGAASNNVSQYTGRENDGTGLYYYRARYYSAGLQRFVSEDPLEFGAGDTNLYAYVYNSPTNYTDPTGRNPWALACLGGAAFSVGMDILSGRKITLGNVAGSAARGCLEGLIGFGIGKALEAGIEGYRAARAAEAASEAVPKLGSAGGPGAGKAFSEATKDAERAASGNRCVFCKEPTTRTPGPDQSNIDHAIPKSRGGNNTPANAQNTCRTCNLEKGTKTTQEYLDYLKNKKP
jgi:RHS repeat-associated protein